MASPSKDCQKSLLEHLDAMNIASRWVSIRECKRVKGTSADVQAWDALFRKALDEARAGDPDALEQVFSVVTDEEKTFFNNVNGLMKSPGVAPGWSDETCTMDWGHFACFCNWCARQPPGHLVSLANSITAGQTIPYECTDAVLKDTAYASEWPEPPASSSSKSAWPWVVGIAAVAALGVGAYAYSRKQNPVSGDTRAAYWKGKRVQLHPGTDRWMMGDRYGEVVGVSRNGKLKIKLDKSGKTISLPESRVQEI